MDGEVFERWDGEPNLWYARFVRFREMGAGRSLEGCYREAINAERSAKGREGLRKGARCSPTWRKKAQEFDWWARAEGGSSPGAIHRSRSQVPSVPKSDKRVSYAALAKGKRIERRLKEKPPVEPVSEFTIVGKPAVRNDGADKVTGKAKFAGDIRLPGMLYAKIVRPPAHGATLKRIEQTPDQVILHPANPTMSPMTYMPDEVKIQGVLVGQMRRY